MTIICTPTIGPLNPKPAKAVEKSGPAEVPRSLPSADGGSIPPPEKEFSVFNPELKPRFETKTIEKATTDAGKYSGQPKPGAAQEAAT